MPHFMQDDIVPGVGKCGVFEVGGIQRDGCREWQPLVDRSIISYDDISGLSQHIADQRTASAVDAASAHGNHDVIDQVAIEIEVVSDVGGNDFAVSVSRPCHDRLLFGGPAAAEIDLDIEFVGVGDVRIAAGIGGEET